MHVYLVLIMISVSVFHVCSSILLKELLLLFNDCSLVIYPLINLIIYPFIKSFNYSLNLFDTSCMI
jgi:hypothetical protein